MSIPLRIAVCLAGFILIYIARKANIARKMTEKQSLFWIIGGLIITIFGLIPQLVFIISDVFKVDYSPSIIFAMSIMLIFYGIFDCYKTNADLIAKVQELAMQVALLNDENVRMKKTISNMNKPEEKKDVEK